MLHILQILHALHISQRDTKNGLGNELTVGTWSILKEDNDEEGMLEMLVDFGPITVTIYVNEEVKGAFTYYVIKICQILDPLPSVIP